MHVPILGSHPLRWPDEAACAAFAGAIAQAIRRQPDLGDSYLELRGPLGAGKTTFVRHLLRALGVTGRIKSPTYAVLEPHALPGLAISHFDFYRFAHPREWADAGFRDLFAAPGLKIAEWPEHAAGHLPRPDLRLIIEPVAAAPGQPDTLREVQAQALSPRGQALLG